ncbi:lysozyme C, milk isozyme-like [Tenrec ecaudatus]|uniref:lysozyme C, milk isozyme-like n=1 Tax=Tenrec ecaudatus TaxID=94439 RepID=UPI003F595E01
MVTKSVLGISLKQPVLLPGADARIITCLKTLLCTECIRNNGVLETLLCTECIKDNGVLETLLCTECIKDNGVLALLGLAPPGTEMKSILIFSLFSCFFAINEAKIFSRCELAHILKGHGLEGYNGYSLENWICLVKHESNFNTRAFNRKNVNGSSDHGIFQLNNQWWCQDNKYPSKNACHIACDKFMDDDIDDDTLCAKRVVNNPDGMAAWVGWKNHCKGTNLSKYLAGCKL